MEILDEKPIARNESAVVYGGFWIRFGAIIIDGIILSPVAFGLLYFNATMWKSMPILILGSLVQIAYKPFCEIYYGATLGKMALKLKVVNYEYNSINTVEGLGRNVFGIVFGIISMLITIYIYTLPEFMDTDGFMEFSALSNQIVISQVVTWTNATIGLADVIVLLMDPQKRSLHDKIGKTYVIER